MTHRPLVVLFAVVLALAGASTPRRAEAATPSTVNATLTAGDTTIRVDWSLLVGDDAANGVVISRDGTSTDRTTPGWTSRPIEGTAGFLTLTHLVNGQTYRVTVQPVRVGVAVGTATVRTVAAGSSATPPPPPPPVAGARGPRPVDLSVQGTAHHATPATFPSVLAATPPGDTVTLAPGSYGNLTLSRKVVGGTVRIVPDPGAAASFGTVALSGSGLDLRGINTTGTVTVTGQLLFWRGGTHQRQPGANGFMIRDTAADIVVEDTTVRDAQVSFYLQGTATTHPKRVTLARYLSQHVNQDHVFGSWGDFVTIRDAISSGHVNNQDHSDGIQIVGLKDVTILNVEITNTIAFRDEPGDRNDHGIMVNYTPGEGRIPERITVDGCLIHNQRGTGMAVAGVRGMTVKNTTIADNGAGGGGRDLVVDPDPGNVVTGWSESGNTIGSRTVTGTS